MADAVAISQPALVVKNRGLLIGAIMLAMGRRKLEPAAIAPRRTAEALRKDTQMMRGVGKHEHD